MAISSQMALQKTVLLIRLTIIALFHGRRPTPGPRGWPPRPLSLAPLNFASGGNYALFQRFTVGEPLSLAPLNFESGDNYAIFPRSIVGPPAPRWPRLSYLAEGDYAQCLGPLCQRDTIVMLVATLHCAAYAMLK